MNYFELGAKGVSEFVVRNSSNSFFNIFSITNPEADQIQTALPPLIYP